MPKPTNLADHFSQKELMLLLEGLFLIREHRQKAMNEANTWMEHLHDNRLKPDDIGLDMIDGLVERFSSASTPMIELVKPIKKSSCRPG